MSPFVTHTKAFMSHMLKTHGTLKQNFQVQIALYLISAPVANKGDSADGRSCLSYYTKIQELGYPKLREFLFSHKLIGGPRGPVLFCVCV